jgi:hypothetical protein
MAGDWIVRLPAFAEAKPDKNLYALPAIQRSGFAQAGADDDKLRF